MSAVFDKPSYVSLNFAPADVSGSVLARFMELRGRQIIRACGTLWYTVPGRFLMSLPYQATLDPDPKEVRAMILDNAMFGARFPSHSWSGLRSGVYVLRNHEYDINLVHAKHRPRVRRALKCFQVRTAEKAELVSQGWDLNLSTMGRQRRYDSEFGEPRRWGRLIEAAFTCPGIAFPAVFAGNRMAAYMITCRDQKWLHILHQMSRKEDLANFPNHLLTYVVTKEALADTTLEGVCYGYVPLFAADGLDEYKLRFGYEVASHRSVFQLHPFLDRVLNQPLTRVAVRIARKLRREDQRLESLETVLEGARTSSWR